MARVDVRKTWKLYIGGAFPRSESGHTYEVADSSGKFVANAALASRKDVRDAVVAARKAFGSWSGRTAYNRAQILYRIAELMEGRRDQFVAGGEHRNGRPPGDLQGGDPQRGGDLLHGGGQRAGVGHLGRVDVGELQRVVRAEAHGPEDPTEQQQQRHLTNTRSR